MNRIATIVKGYPRLSETFIAQEIRGLEKRGIPQLIVSLRQPTDGQVHQVHREIDAEVLYLPEYLKDDPARVRAGRRWAEQQPGFAQARRAFEADYARDRSVNRLRRWGQACVLGHELPADIRWLHTHYLHTPASVTRYAALLLGMGWSFSAHAKDIWTTAEWDLREKLAEAAWGVTCTAANLRYLQSLSVRPKSVRLVYHGLDLSGFPPVPKRTATQPPALSLVSVGRAVEKKGYGDLLHALADLRDLPWRLHHVGGGPLSKRLKEQAQRLGLEAKITWHGLRDREFILDLLTKADLFVLPSRITRSGDRDGLPNVLMEAQAMAVPVLSTALDGITELVIHGETGWLVPEKDPAALAGGLWTLLEDPGLRMRLATAGARRVRKDFSANPGIDAVAALLNASVARIAA